MEYRRIKGRDTWHFMEACQHWRRMVAGRYVSVEQPGRPSTGELCNECLGKQRRKL